MAKALQDDAGNSEYILGAGRMLSVWSWSSASSAEKTARLLQAQQVLKRGIEIDPYNIQILSDYGQYSFELGQLYAANGNLDNRAVFEEARLAFMKLRDLGIADANTYLNLAMIYDKLDEYDGAKRLFRNPCVRTRGVHTAISSMAYSN